MSSFLDFADKIAGEALDGARAAIRMQFATLDDVGADALLLRALSRRAGRERYNRETLDWLIDAAYWTGFSPYILHLAVGIEPTQAEGYDPFSLYHKEVPRADEDERDPYPSYLRPLRFIPDDLQQWEIELGTTNPDTVRLVGGFDDR